MADTVQAEESRGTVTQPATPPPVREDWAGGLSVARQCLLLFVFSAIWMIILMFIIMGLTTGPISATWSDYVNVWATIWYVPVVIILLATISPIIRDRRLRRQGR